MSFFTRITSLPNSLTNSVIANSAEFPIFRGMKTSIYILIISLVWMGCKPIQEKIIGTYEIDADRGCSNCEDNGPELMVFENFNVSDGIPGYYRFGYQNGESHSGTYDFLQMDTLLRLTLYPDSSSIQFYGIVGSIQYTDYRVVGNKIKENCDGIFRNCVWVRRD